MMNFSVPKWMRAELMAVFQSEPMTKYIKIWPGSWFYPGFILVLSLGYSSSLLTKNRKLESLNISQKHEAGISARWTLEHSLRSHTKAAPTQLVGGNEAGVHIVPAT